jgi:hypothetical protein
LILVASASVALAQGGGAGTGQAGGSSSVVVMTGAPSTQPSLPEGAGALSGVVVDATTGSPLVGAIVTLSVASRASVTRAPRETTDSRGRFLFTKLPAHDDYQLSAAMPGYFDAAYVRTSLRPMSTTLVLTEGQWIQNADLSLVKGGSITGTVLDERGDPVVGVYVHVFAEVLVAGTRLPASGPAATTDDRGIYRVAGLGPGDYLVSVPSVASSVPALPLAGSNAALVAVFDADTLSRLPLGRYPIPPPPRNGQRLTYPVIYAPDATSPSRATPVTLAVGESRSGVDIRLEPVPASRVSGHVDGPPEALTGLTLRLLPAGLENLGSGAETATALVAPDGSFAFLNVPAGSYTIDVRRAMMELNYSTGGGSSRLPFPPGPNGYSINTGSVEAAPPGIQYSSTTFGNPTGFWGRAAVVVAANDVMGVVVPLRLGATVSGHVTHERKDASKPPARPSLLLARAEPANGTPETGLARQGQPPQDPDDFLLEGLTPGQYVLRFNQPAGTLVRSIVFDGADYTHRPLNLTDGRDVTNVQVTFTDNLPTLTGSIRGDDAALKTSVVIAFPVEPDQWSNYGLTPDRIKTSRPSAAGTFRFSTLPEGDYYLFAAPGSEIDAWQDPAYLQQAAKLATRVSLKWGQTTNADVTLVREP